MAGVASSSLPSQHFSRRTGSSTEEQGATSSIIRSLEGTGLQTADRDGDEGKAFKGMHHDTPMQAMTLPYKLRCFDRVLQRPVGNEGSVVCDIQAIRPCTETSWNSSLTIGGSQECLQLLCGNCCVVGDELGHDI